MAQYGGLVRGGGGPRAAARCTGATGGQDQPGRRDKHWYGRPDGCFPATTRPPPGTWSGTRGATMRSSHVPPGGHQPPNRLNCTCRRRHPGLWPRLNPRETHLAMVYCLPGQRVAGGQAEPPPAKPVSSAPVVVVLGGVGMGLAVDLVIPLVHSDAPGVAREPPGEAGSLWRSRGEKAGGRRSFMTW